MRIAFLGNFGPSFSTESHLAVSFESLGHEVVRLQEGEVRALDVPDRASGCDLFVWVQTYGLAVSGGTLDERRWMIDELRSRGIFSLSLHLDRWWGLDRQDQIDTEPFFRTDLVATADGGHAEQWKQAGINHMWFPPGICHTEAHPGTFRQRWQSDIAFVGFFRPGYHAEWTHRPHLIQHLKRRWRNKVKFFPTNPRQPVRGADLRDLYASVKVCVGDSCLVPKVTGEPQTLYHSDRIPETLGRGGFLLHPHVEGVTDGLYVDGQHLGCWPLGDWDSLDSLIAYYLEHSDLREQIAQQGRAHVLEHHTYRVRLQRVLEHISVLHLGEALESTDG